MANIGRIKQIIGPVVDVSFSEEGSLSVSFLFVFAGVVTFYVHAFRASGQSVVRCCAGKTSYDDVTRADADSVVYKDSKETDAI